MKFPTRFILFLCVVLAMAVAWGSWNLNEDLYMSLRAGKDVADGQFTQPDQWSFATQGRIWINQGWLSGYLFYLSYVYFQEWGPCLIKGVLLILCLAVLYFRRRRLDVSVEIALLATLAGTLAVAPHMSMRAENFAVLYFVLLTTLLTAPASLGVFRQAGTLLVMLIWVNSHGSFMIGFVLIGLKALTQIVVSAVRGCSAGEDKGNFGDSAAARLGSASFAPSGRGDSLLWWLTWVLSLGLMAFANPFGPANLQMPFQQVGTEIWTRHVKFWVPLIRLDAAGQLRLYTGTNSLPYILELVLGIVLAAATVAMVGFSRFRTFLLRERLQGVKGDLLTEVLICFAMIVLTFKFGRAAIFTAPGLIPLLGFLMQSLVQAFKFRRSRREQVASTDLPRRIGALFSTGLLALMIWFFSVQTLIPYLPGNPVTPAATLPKQIMGPFSTEMSGLIEFLKNNHFRGRMFASWQLASAIILQVPDLKIFMDLRAQSIYADQVKIDYDAIVAANPQDSASVRRALDLLDRYKVESVAYQKALEVSRLPEALLGSEKWRPVYVDAYGLVFVRHDSDMLSKFPDTGGLDYLWYPDRQTRLVSQAVLWLKVNGSMPADMESQLRDAALTDPLDLIYRTIVISRRMNTGCLDNDTKKYLYSELRRLAGTDMMRPEGINLIIGSMVEIIGALETDHRTCGKGPPPMDFARVRQSLIEKAERTRKQFLPWVWTKSD